MLLDCELNKNALSTMQSGGFLPRVETLAKIADYLDCSVDYLLGRVQEPNITYTNISSGNIINGSNGNNSPLTINQSDMTDEMGIELLKAFQKLKFTDKLYFLNNIIQKSNEK